MGGVSPRGCMTDAISVYPHQGRRHHTEVEMVGDREGIARLALTAADLLLYFSEPGFDIPSTIHL